MILVPFIRKNWIVFTTGILVAITVLSLSPLDSLPPVPSSDKTHHFIAYAVLAIPTALRRPRRWLLLAFLFVAYSGIIELVQPFVNRYREWADMLANISGVACGFIIVNSIRILFPASSRRSTEHR